MSPNDIRRAVRAEFERHRYVSDPRVVDVLLQKGQQSYQETVNAWSQEPHILGILLAPKSRPQRTFMEKFLEGTVLLAWIRFNDMMLMHCCDFVFVCLAPFCFCQGEMRTRCCRLPRGLL